MNRWGLTCLAAALAATTGCLREELSETEQPIINYGSTPLELTWMKTSHNTYEAGHTPSGESVAWHFDRTTNHIELDLLDTHILGPVAGDWIVAHNSVSSPTDKCGGGWTLTSCLAVIAAWHSANPGHALLTVWLDKKQNWEGTGYSQRSAVRLDAMLYNWFGSALVRPGEISATNLRSTVFYAGWPAHSALNNRVMFILTSDANGTGNARLRDYVNFHLWNANAFVAPYATTSSHVTAMPYAFNTTALPWVAIYNFKWTSSSADGECDSESCYYLRTAHDRGYLTRVWDVDDYVEADFATSRPWGTTYGHANFVAINYPDQYGVNGGYGNWPDGIYPW